MASAPAPESSSDSDFFDEEFSDWTGDTGFHLPLKNPKVKEKAIQIFKLNC